MPLRQGTGPPMTLKLKLVITLRLSVFGVDVIKLETGSFVEMRMKFSVILSLRTILLQKGALSLVLAILPDGILLGKWIGSVRELLVGPLILG